MRNPEQPTPLSDAAIADHWEPFNEEVHHFLADQTLPHMAKLRATVLARIDMGGKEHGDSSFLCSEEELLAEAQNEQLDQYSYAFFGWARFNDPLYLTIAAHAANGYAKVADIAAYKASLPAR